MKSNYTTEEVNGFLDDFKSRHYEFNTVMSIAIEQFKKDKGLIPTLEVGWYRYDSEPKYLMYRDKSFLYGFCTDGSWLDKESDHNGLIGINEYTLATTEEVETALKAEATKRGFKEGVTVECLTGNFKTALAGDYYQPNGYDYDQIWMLESTGDSVQLFARGKWAKIAEPKVLELTMSELENKYGCKVKIIKE